MIQKNVISILQIDELRLHSNAFVSVVLYCSQEKNSRFLKFNRLEV